MYVFILFIILTMTLLSYQCPNRCICINQKNAVPASYCDGLRLDKVPGNFMHSTEILSLRKNSLRKLNDNDFNGMHELIKLNLVHNKITEISNNAFRGLRSLKILNLGNNYLKTFSYEAFKHLVSLEELFLNNNLMETLPKDIFRALPNLQRLHLFSNNIELDESNEIYSTMDNLIFLDLSNNKIKSVNNQLFENSRKLKWLYLNDNSINHIADNSFDSLSELTELSLENNSIESISKNIITNKDRLARVSIYNNPFKCNCRIVWLYDLMLIGMPVILSMDKIFCNSPSTYEGMPLSQLSIKTLNCFDDWDPWVKWSSCSRTCGTGVRYRLRICNTNARSGSCRGSYSQSESCNTFSCNPGVISAWSEWSKCSASCQGKSTRGRKCVDPYTGEEATTCIGDTLVESKSCNEINCPIPGGWSKWNEWSPCDKECGLGMKRRKRTCSNPLPQYGGALCEGSHSQQENKICFKSRCDPKTNWGQWSRYSECSESCGRGVKTRKRSCLNEYNRPINIVNICPGNHVESTECQATNSLCKHDGGWSKWSPWSRCSKFSCQRFRERTCSEPTVKNGGRGCIGERKEYEQCNLKECVVNTVWGQWGQWTSCNKPCNGGIKKRSRECIGEKYPFITCGNKKVELKSCNRQPCTNTQWTQWSVWTECNNNRFHGKQVRRRACISFGRKRCPGKERQRRSCQSNDWQHGGGVISAQFLNCKGNKISNGYEKLSKLSSNKYVATYYCNKYYKLKGSQKLTCIPGKGWSPYDLPYCIAKCGKPVHKSYFQWGNRARLFGGSATVPHSWPWQVAIEVNTHLEGWKLKCGGSLINDKWIVTAAHCLFDKAPVKRLFEPDEIRIFLGVHNVSHRYKSKDIQQIEGNYVEAHPLFHQPTLDKDIGLIQLKTKAQFKDTVLPVCLPSSKQKNLSKPGKTGTVIGWGATRQGRGSEVLKELQLPVVSHAECVNAYLNKYNITSSMFCAGKRHGNEDTCKGDSGGGYLFYDNRKNKWTLQGVVSWGGDSCGTAGQFSVYSRVPNFTSWIRKVMKKRIHSNT